MEGISVVALFCSDIREEKSNTATIVGVLPDNLNAPIVPGMLPKLCVYVRMHVDVDFDPGRISTRIVMNGEELTRNDVEDELLQTTRAKAKASGKPYVGLISTFVMSPLTITKAGPIEALVTVRDKEYVAGALNIRLVEPKTS